jgi:hypothetical protein
MNAAGVSTGVANFVACAVKGHAILDAESLNQIIALLCALNAPSALAADADPKQHEGLSMPPDDD